MEEPNNRQLKRETVSKKRIKALKAKKSKIKKNKKQFLKEEKKKVEDVIKTLPDRKPTKKGNKTMKEFLTEVSAEVDKQEYVDKVIKRIDEDIISWNRQNGSEILDRR